MSSELASHIEGLTSAEVIEKCRRRGVAVTTPQLARWKREGLLDPPALQGRGKSGGVGRLWSPETVDRAMLIARTLGHGDPSLKRAARVLVGGGFLIRADVLQALILDEVTRVGERLAVRRRDFLDAPLRDEDKRQRVRESVDRRNKGKPEQVKELLADLTIGMLGLRGPGNASDWTVLGEYLSQQVLRGVITEASAQDLSGAFYHAEGLSIGGMLFATLFSSAGSPPLWMPQWGNPHHDLPRLTDVPKTLEDAYLDTSSTRLLGTLWHLLKRRYGEEFITATNRVLGAGLTAEPPNPNVVNEPLRDEFYDA